LRWWGNRYQRVYEAAVFLLVIVVAVCFIIQLTYTKPDMIKVLKGFVPVPELVTNADILYLAVAILGATVSLASC
jgi:manganese transport protein